MGSVIKFNLKVIIKNEDNTTEIKIDACREILIAKCEYFSLLLTSFNTAHSNKIEIIFPYVFTFSDVVRSLHGLESDVGRIPKWQYILEKYFCCDFMRLEFDMALLDEIQVPKEGFELLLAVIKHIGYDDRTVRILNNNIPENYCYDDLPKKLIDFVTEQNKNVNHAILTDKTTIYVMDNKSDSKIRKLVEHPGKILYHFCLSPDNEYICATFGDFLETSANDIFVYEIKTGKLIHTLIEHSQIKSICYSPDGKTIASGDNKGTQNYRGTVKIWDTKSGKQIRNIYLDTTIENIICYSPDNSMLILNCLYGIDIRETTNYNLINTFEDICVRILCVSHDSEKIIIAVHQSKAIKVLNIKNNTVKRLTGHNSYVDNIYEDEFIMISFDYDGIIKIWNPKNYELLRSVSSYEKFIHNYRQFALENHLIFSTDGEKIILYHAGQINQWDIDATNNINIINCTRDVRNMYILRHSRKLTKIIRSAKEINMIDIKKNFTQEHHSSLIEIIRSVKYYMIGLTKK